MSFWSLTALIAARPEPAMLLLVSGLALLALVALRKGGA